MRALRVRLYSAAVFLFSSAVLAAPTAELIDAGIVVPVGPQKRIPDPTSATGFRWHGDASFKSHTVVAPAEQGVAFGISFRIDGLPSGPTRYAQIVTSPPLKKPDGTVLTEQVSYQEIGGTHGSVIYGKTFYTLREAYEVVPGEWSIAIAIGSQQLLKQKFFVRAPAPKPGEAPPNPSLQRTSPGRSPGFGR